VKRPSFQFYPGDWLSNKNLRRCSFTLRGVWIDTVCLMADSEEHGVLRWPLAELANAVGCRLAELQALRDKKVLKGADTGERFEGFTYTPRHAGRDGEPVVLVPVQDGPIWISSRMVRDEYKRANAGAETRFKKPIDVQTERARLRAAVLAKTGGHCAHCKALLGDVWEIDHFIPRAKGGRHTFANLVPSCVACNQDKSDTLPDDWSPPGSTPSRREGDGSSASTSSSPPEKDNYKPTVGLPPDGGLAGETEKAKARREARAAGERAIAYLNAKAGTRFQPTEANLRFAVGRILYDKASEQDLQAVVDLKVAESKRGEFDRKYLRPATLFGAEKFSQYSGQVGVSSSLPPAAALSTTTVVLSLQDQGSESSRMLTSFNATGKVDAWDVVKRSSANPGIRREICAHKGYVLVEADRDGSLVVLGKFSASEVAAGLAR
jgi:uncharacterized phage protein (TIGR02220 family)